MKKVFLLTAALMAIAAGVNAQSFKKGDFFLNGRVSGLDFSYTFENDISYTNLELSANAGYFISDKFAVDAIVAFEHEKITNSSTHFGFGAGVRYYPVGNLFAGVGYIGYRAKEFDSHLKISAGYDFFLSETVFIEPVIFYTKELVENRTNDLGLALGIGVKF